METEEGVKLYRRLMTDENGNLTLVEADEAGNVLSEGKAVTVSDERRAVNPALTAAEPVREDLVISCPWNEGEDGAQEGGYIVTYKPVRCV